MAFFKQIFQYTQNQYGFSETYFLSATDINAASAFNQTLYNALLSIRSPLTTLNKVRTSAVTNNRITNVVNINQPGTASQALEGPDVASTAAIVTLNSATKGYRRQVWFRGLPDIMIARNPSSGTDEPSPQLLQGITAITIQLARGLYQVRALTKLTGTWPLAKTAVTAINFTTPPNCLISTNQTTTSLTPILISGASRKDWPGLNGLWNPISWPGGVGFQIAYKAPQGAPQTSSPDGIFVRPAIYDYDNIAPFPQSALNKLGKRDTGRNPLAGRGRRSAQRLRLA